MCIDVYYLPYICCYMYIRVIINAVRYTGGQSSTGSLLQWARRLFSGGHNNNNNSVNNNNSHNSKDDNSSSSTSSTELLSLSQLDSEAEGVPVGAEGLMCLETFQGSRTPITGI